MTLNVVEFPEFTEPPKGAPKAQETENDKHLLTKVLPVLLEHIPDLPMLNLLQQGEAASAKGPYNIYTEDTHRISCSFMQATQMLQGIIGQPQDLTQPSNCYLGVS